MRRRAGGPLRHHPESASGRDPAQEGVLPTAGGPPRHRRRALPLQHRQDGRRGRRHKHPRPRQPNPQ